MYILKGRNGLLEFLLGLGGLVVTLNVVVGCLVVTWPKENIYFYIYDLFVCGTLFMFYIPKR